MATFSDTVNTDLRTRPKPRAGRRKPCLLVVEDDAVARALIKTVLGAEGYEVEVAGTVAEAVELLGDDTDLVVLDIGLPERNVLEWLGGVRKQRSANELPIIILASPSDDRLAVRAMGFGANDQVGKPLDTQVLLARVKTQLSLRQARESINDKVRQVERLADQLRRRNRFIREVFGRYMSPAIVDRLLFSSDRLNLTGERQEVTVMFTDLRGFTGICESMPAADLLAMLNNYFEEMIEVVQRWGGIISEFLGDGMLVFFGTPVRVPDHALRATGCAVELQQSMDRVNDRNRESGWPLLRMGIGINSGEGVVGNLGSVKRTKFGVVGSVVNLASRIEGMTAGNDVLISESTFMAVGQENIQFGETHFVTPKGFSHPVEVMSVGAVQWEGEWLALPSRDSALQKLSEALPAQFRLLSGGGEAELLDGRIARLSDNAAELRCDRELPLFETIIVEQMDNVPLHIRGKLTAKAAGGANAYRVQIHQAEVGRFHETATFHLRELDKRVGRLSG